MDLLFTIFGPAAIAAALLAIAVGWCCRLALPASWAQRWTLPLAASLAFVGGYVLLPRDWAPLVPKQSWHWLPYLAVAAALSSLLRRTVN